MTTTTPPPLLLPMPDGSTLSLHFSRFDERQQRLRLRLPKTATCWDYAPLIDVVRREPGFKVHCFSGRTVAEWLADLQRQRSPDELRFKRWYEALVQCFMQRLARGQRVPDNHYCIELAVPPLVSTLPNAILGLGLKRASIEQWLATLRALTGKGVKPEELHESGVLVRLQRMPADAPLTQAEVLRLINLSYVIPKFASESRFGFVPKAGWYETCQRIPVKEFKRRGLWAEGYGGSWYVIRYRHRSLGWSIIRCRHRDLFTKRSDWWGVLDERGRLLEQTVDGFDSPEDAMAFAELQMSQRFAAWGRDQVLTRWERFSLPGSVGYQEILLQLDDWSRSYQSRHYRTRNVLVHIRSGIRHTSDGRRVLFLDEVQSDWHADLHAEAKPNSRKKREIPPPYAPFKNEWPLLTMKLMVWWAQRLGVDGVAWSTAELQAIRWRGFGPPQTLYRVSLPDAAKSLAKTLGIAFDQTQLSVRTNARRVDLGKRGWTVRNREGVAITKPFRTREQAEHMADQTGKFVVIDVPVLWIEGMQTIQAIPLYGVSVAKQWFQGQVDRMDPSACTVNAGSKGLRSE
ncbi:MAG: hypothetical protein U1E84_16660 [Rhodoferax sp.]